MEYFHIKLLNKHKHQQNHELKHKIKLLTEKPSKQHTHRLKMFQI